MVNLNAIFEEATSIVTNLPPGGKVQFSKEQQAKLDGLHKQATEGDCKEKEPKDSKAKAVHEAWASNKGMDQDAAKQKYVDTLKNILKSSEEGEWKTLLDQLGAAA